MVGLFLVFEGPEGSGKSTQVRLLANALEHEGYRVCQTREPGGTLIGERIRGLLLERTTASITPETEALLHTAARAQHVNEVIRPALARGEIVLSDRFVDSTLAYQGGGSGISIEELNAIQRLALGDVKPDRRILFDLPVEIGLSRRRNDAVALNRIDELDDAFHHRVRATYRSLAADNPNEWSIVDATDAPEVVAANVRAVIDNVITTHGIRPNGRLGEVVIA